MTRLGHSLYPHWHDQRANRVQRLLPAWDYKYPRQLALVRTLAGLWFLILTAILLSYHRGETWAWLLVPSAVLSFLAAWYVPRAVAAVTGSSNAN
jgi:hypothetical protein